MTVVAFTDSLSSVFYKSNGEVARSGGMGQAILSIAYFCSSGKIDYTVALLGKAVMGWQILVSKYRPYGPSFLLE
jgi:hypothetical protein